MHLWCTSVCREIGKGPMGAPWAHAPSHSHAAGCKTYFSGLLSCAFLGKLFTLPHLYFFWLMEVWTGASYPGLLQNWAPDFPSLLLFQDSRSIGHSAHFSEDKRLLCNSGTVSPSIIMKEKKKLKITSHLPTPFHVSVLSSISLWRQMFTDSFWKYKIRY